MITYRDGYLHSGDASSKWTRYEPPVFGDLVGSPGTTIPNYLRLGCPSASSSIQQGGKNLVNVLQVEDLYSEVESILST